MMYENLDQVTYPIKKLDFQKRCGDESLMKFYDVYQDALIPETPLFLASFLFTRIILSLSLNFELGQTSSICTKYIGQRLLLSR